ncbi:MAG: hypothetical protein ABIW16_06570, partial [Sphingomicrobium sp.]
MVANPHRPRLPRVIRAGAAIIAALSASAAVAGPPYDTDDPEPTELGHWEIYAFTGADGRHGDVDGVAGFDLNYGPIADVQLTATLPLGFAHQAGRSGWRGGAGDVELGVKYRFVHLEQAGFSVAIFPRVILPTARSDFGSGRTRLLLPVWAQQDFGRTALFGGGGWTLNPGPGNRNVWQAGVALTRDLSDSVTLGGEATWQGRDSADGAATATLGAGPIVQLGGPFALLVSGGPSFSAGRTGYHA